MMMSKQMNECFALSGIPLYQSITESVFLHWFNLVVATTFLLILSRICLLMIPISDLDGFMSLHVGLLLKFGLWSFKVTNASFSAVDSILLAKLSCVAIFFSSAVMLDVAFLGAFLYALVMLFSSSLLYEGGSMP